MLILEAIHATVNKRLALRRSGSNHALEVILDNVVSHKSEQAMGNREMQILDNLHVVGSNN